MNLDLTINLGNLLLSLSDVMELASPDLAGHQLRTAFIAWELCRKMELPDETTKQVFMGSLVHDVGALTPEEKSKIHAFMSENYLEAHCIRGALLLRANEWSKPLAVIARNHHRHWADWDLPIEAPGVLESQIVKLADQVKRLIDRQRYILHQSQEIISKIKAAAGTELHPLVVDLFRAVLEREEFWLDLVSPRLYMFLLNHGPCRNDVIERKQLFSISSLFRNIIDFRSHFTATHSSGVAASAANLAQIFGFSEVEVRLMEIAGYFHDIGKLIVPTAILEKPGKLTREEFAVIKQHTYFSYMVLDSIGGLREIAEWAAFHHEKLDGSGYPFHKTRDDLTAGASIMAVADIFTALTEDRPYRRGMKQRDLTRIIQEQSNAGLHDSKVVKLLLDNYGQLARLAREKQAIAEELYRQQGGAVLV